jgi:hypothetical protein
MKTIFQFLWASFASAVAAMVLLGLGIQLTVIATTGSLTGEGFWPSLGAMVVTTGFVIVFGGIIALPAAMVAGGAMLWAEHARGKPLALSIWVLVGLVIGLLVVVFVGATDTRTLLLHAPWHLSASALGAWVFAREWRRGRNSAGQLQR